MQILAIWKGFEVFESKFEPFQRVRSIQMQIRTIRMGFKAFEYKFEPFDEAFESRFEPFERDLKHSNANLKNSKGIRSIRM